MIGSFRFERIRRSRVKEGGKSLGEPLSSYRQIGTMLDKDGVGSKPAHSCVIRLDTVSRPVGG